MNHNNLAIILFAHGARDPRWAEPIHALQRQMQALSESTWIQPAYLEFMTPSLAEAVDAAVAAGMKHIRVVPVFFGQGGHLRQEFPLLLEACRQSHPQITISATPPVGEWPEVIACIAGQALRER